jgi:hypothetical protein
MRATAFSKVPLKIVGQTYKHRSKAVSIQKTMNLIPQIELTGAAESSLVSWPGLTSVFSGSGINRGMTVFNDELYKVTGNTLYKIDSLFNATSLGSIAGTTRCIFESDGTNLIITTGNEMGNNGYQLTGTKITGYTLSKISDGNYENASSCALFNNYMTYDGDDNKFQLAEAGDPDNLNADYIARAESKPDDTVRVFVWREQLYIFCTGTVEVWYFTGAGDPPIARVSNATMPVGLAALHSVQATDEYIYFLGDDRRVYRFSATQPENITSIAISHELDQLGDLSGAIGDVVSIEGQSFYKLNVQGKTFVFNESSKAWFNLSTTANEDMYRFDSFVECYGKRLCADGGSVLELNLDAYDNNGEVIINERIFGPITSRDLGVGGDNALMSRIWLNLETGTGLATGQGSNPQLMVSVSTDGGDSFTNEQDVLAGRTGEGDTKVSYDYLKYFKSLFIKVRCSDPVFLSLYGADIEVKPGGI